MDRHGYPPSLPPGQYDPTGVFYNPGNTIPGPAPSVRPTGAWDMPPVEVIWTAGTVDVVRTATWRTPIFDLRPELRASTPAPPQGVQPIWRGLGAGSQLFVFVRWDGLPSGLNVTVQERAHPCDVTRIATVTAPQDVTHEFTGTKQAALQGFMPIGNGYPTRFWQIIYTFDIVEAVVTDPRFTVEAAMY